MLYKAIKDYESIGVDPGYQGVYEERYCRDFISYMGGGFADAVSSGSGSVYIAIAALGLKKNTKVLVSPISDPGTYGAIILNGLVPKLIDTKKLSYNVGIENIERRLDPEVSAVLIVHATGQTAELDKIAPYLRSKNLLCIEDCSQAHGASIDGKKIGTFGDVAAFSTMYRKNHITVGSGGLVFTKS